MRIRTKILLLLLVVSLPPLLFLRINGVKTMTNLAETLGAQSSNMLVHRTSNELMRIVEDHARLLDRERDLVGTALDLLAKAVSVTHKQDRGLQLTPDFTTDPRYRSHYSGEMNASAAGETGDMNSGRMGRMMKTMMRMQGFETEGESSVSFSSIGFSPSTPDPIQKKIASVLPILQRNARKYPDLILWQRIETTSGFSAFFPDINASAQDSSLMMAQRQGAGRMSHQGVPSQRERYTLSSPSEDVVWRAPAPDRATGAPVFSAVRSVFDAEDNLLGTVAIDVPVNTLLRDPGHLKHLSENVHSYILSVRNGSDQFTVLASQDSTMAGMHWRAAKQRETLNVPHNNEAGNIINDILSGNAGTWGTTIDGEEQVLAYAPLQDKGLVFVIAVPLADIIQEARFAAEHVKDSFSEQMEVTQIFLITSVLAVIVAAFYFSAYFSKRFTILVSGVRAVGRGDFSTRIPVTSSDEIGELSSAFNEMVPALEENVHIKESLELANTVQQSLLPRNAPEMAGYDIAGASYYCTETGGDYYDFIPCISECGMATLIAVGDVAGHGLSSALLMATARAYLRSKSGSFTELPQTVSAANNLVARDTFGTGQFMTLFFARIDGTTDEINWVRAGHDAALLYRSATEEFIDLKGDGATALGVVENMEYPENSATIQEGDVLLIATDGIWEQMSPEGKMFSKQKVRALIKEYASHSSDQLIKILYQAVRGHAQKDDLDDDFTCVVLKKHSS